MTEGYRKLFEAGITEIDNCIRLAGAPLTAGFWKSFVEVERGKRWTWDDDSFADNLHEAITLVAGGACGAGWQYGRIYSQDAITALHKLRDGKIPAEFDGGMGEMIVSALFARDHKLTQAADVMLLIDSPAGKQTLHCRFFEKIGQRLQQEQFQEWIENHHALLAGNEISIVITGFSRWELPSPGELHRLGRISGYRIPEVFGPTEARQAVSKFGDGDIQGCMGMFLRMLADKDDFYARNNLAFCQLLTGDVAAGLENATKAAAGDYHPLFELNKGIGEFLQGNVDIAKSSLRNALQQIRAQGSKFDPSVDYVLVLEPTEKKVSSHGGLPIDAAILINLWRMGDLTKVELETELANLDPEKAQLWLASFAA